VEKNKSTQAGDVYVPSLLDKIRGKFSGLPWYLWIFLIVALITSLLLAVYYIFPSVRNKVNKPAATPTDVWTPYNPTPPPILGGTQTYRVSGNKRADLPSVTEVTLDPQDAKKDQQQTITIKANGPTEIKEVIAILHLDDNKDFEYILDFKEGSKTNGTWAKTISFPSTYNNAYRLTYKARNENNLGDMATITIR
jgi:hypothetical protein